ncbi:MAG: hypothetical protein J6D26_07605 [Clostridia bacterium]|nr:hypothetical protein [Clostridia bacterium]
MSNFRRCAFFLKASDSVEESQKLKVLHDFADANNLLVTVTLRSEQEFLESKEAFDLIVTTDTIMLPIAGVEIVRVQ